MRHFLHAFTLCLYAILPWQIHAQPILRFEEPLVIRVEEIGIAQGLSQGMIHGLAVDLKGYLWAGTKDGLNRYDGSHFHVFRNDPKDPQSIASNYIRSLYIDSRGLIWVGTNTEGLDLFNPATEEFIHFGKRMNANSTSSIQSVSKIFGDPSGKILIWDDDGKHAEILISRPGEDLFDFDTWDLKPLEQVYTIPQEAPLPAMNNMIGFKEDGALLFIKDHQFYALYQNEVKELTPPDVIKYFGLSKAITGNNVQYFIDSHHRPYCLFRDNRQLFKWDESTGSFQAWLNLPKEFPSNYVYFMDARDRMWCFGLNSPVVRIDIEKETCQEISWRNENGQLPEHFYIACEDQNHNLWAGTSGTGIIKISTRNDQFTSFDLVAANQIGKPVIRNGRAFSIHDHFTQGHHVQLNSDLFEDELIQNSNYTDDSLGQLYCMAVNFQQQHVLLRIDGTDYSVISPPLQICASVTNDQDALLIDKLGEIWMATVCSDDQARLVRLNYFSGTQVIFTFPVEVIQTEHGFITSSYVDDQNMLWLGTKQGLFVFNPLTTQWKHFHVDLSRPDALSNNFVLSICPDPKLPGRYLWVGTDGGGLNKMNIQAETFRHYTTADGLPNNVIYAVQSDRHDNLWMSTNLGICRFDPDASDVWSFTGEDGLQGNEFNRLLYGTTSDGRLYFGGVEGATIFDPEVFYTDAASSPIVINRLKLSNKEIGYASLNSNATSDNYRLPRPIEHCQKLTFPYSERMITLGFSLLDFTNPNGNKYRYKLEGFNDEWIEAGDVNEAVFTNLSPGNYTFLVSGSNSQHVWSQPAQLGITILSPWWSTWWFRSLLFVIIAAGVYTFFQYRYQQALKLQHLRNRIAADLHDEIGSTLSSISLAGTVIQQKLKNRAPEVDGLLNKINNNTQSMMEAMSDIVWAVNTKNDRFDQVLHRMRAFAVEILEPKDIMVHFEVSPTVNPLQLDMQQRKNLYLVFKEVIHNASKYAQCENVWVALSYSYGRLTMKIRDDGKGFDMQPVYQVAKSKQGMGGNGIQNMHQRANELKGKLEINSSPGEGTEVKLTFNL